MKLTAGMEVLLVATYGHTGDKGGPNNLALLEFIGQTLEMYEAWCVGGDWNLTPEELADTGWLDKTKATVLEQDEDTESGTCFPGGSAEPSYLDYFVGNCAALPLLQGTGLDRSVPFGTHRVACARMAADPCKVLVPKLGHSADIPADRTRAGWSWEQATKEAEREEQRRPKVHHIVEKAITGHPCESMMQALDKKLRCCAPAG